MNTEQEIANQVKSYKGIIAELKEKSPYYPKVLIEYYEAHDNEAEVTGIKKKSKNLLCKYTRKNK